MFGQLVPCGGGNPLPLLKTRVLIGRSAECDVSLASGSVSSKHCLLEQREGAWFVTDLVSRNGIRIDGVRCHEGNLPPGSVLWIAQLRFQVEYALAGGPGPAHRTPSSWSRHSSRTIKSASRLAALSNCRTAFRNLLPNRASLWENSFRAGAAHRYRF